MLEQFWLFALVAPLLVGLAIGLYVLRNIVRDAADHEPTHPEAGERPAHETAGNVCSNCETANDPTFQYCSECAAKL